MRLHRDFPTGKNCSFMWRLLQRRFNENLEPRVRTLTFFLNLLVYQSVIATRKDFGLMELVKKNLGESFRHTPRVIETLF